VVEQFNRLGGGCTHWATIPSKALRYAIFQMTEANRNPLFRTAGVSLHFPVSELRRSAQRVIEQQLERRAGFYGRNHVPIPARRARFVDPQTLEVSDDNSARQRLKAKSFVIATGSRRYRPPDIDFGHPRIFDSDTILDLDYTPQSMTIYGAGVVGC